ncbi:MAG: DNA starvation/stationary phase protection protein [Bacteroidetes bacterium HGW-Bacteroidetes-6]|nr:MAG: DNA starvation/stationary phase protection protein [Bacteroidetes bacterium HGW-Bacteroidetes-6]
MKDKNQIGLDQFKSIELSAKLNQLLADYQIFYMNVRGFHWNIKGEKFFELHLKFEELYNNLILKIDEIAERVLTLGDTPVHAYSDYLRMSSIKEVKDTGSGNECVAAILDSMKKVLVLQREILLLAAEAEDEGTNALMSDYIREQEKMVWMYNAYLK